MPGEETEAIFELAEERANEPASHRETAEPTAASAAEFTEPPGSAPVAAESSGGSPVAQASVHKAIEEVNAIVDCLRTSLDDMEEVLEMLELFERQKNADEHEIESLRRALRQMHRPRDGGHSR